jgi:hypothetical protein
MKKVLLIISILALSVVLVACAEKSNTSKDNDLFEQANALMEEGKYEEAIAIYESIESYQKVATKISEAEALLAESDSSDDYLYTKWIDVINYPTNPIDTDPKTLTFHDDGSVYERKGSTEYLHRFVWENGEIAIIASTQVVVLRLSVEESDGVMHLKGSYGSIDYDFVPEKDYERFNQG